MKMSRIPDLVKDAELQTRFQSDRTVHIYTESGETAEERALLREEHWKRKSDIGSGSYGSVWLEQRVRGQGPVRWRAVKKVIKAPPVPGQKPVDYYRELEAISKFSHRNYDRCFVKCFGWYQDPSAVYIAMEYLEQGDLHHHLRSSPPLSEPDVQQVCYQILEGLKFMHENGYTHRDVKPGNILLKSKPPDGWWVKLSDFGISKRAEVDNPAASSHMQGTYGYMAPELFKFVQVDRALSARNAQAADIWAVGEIAFQMLTKEAAFRSLGDLSNYARQPDQFPAIFLRARNITSSAISFIQRLMQPKAEDRPTAANAMQHAWLEEAQITNMEKWVSKSVPALKPISKAVVSADQGPSVASRRPPAPPLALLNPGSVPPYTARWSTVSVAASPPRIPERRASTPGRDNRANAVVLAKPRSATAEPQAKRVKFTNEARFFVLKSYNERNIETSSAHGIWCSNKANNTRLSNAFNSTSGPVFLMFSVNESRRFCGVAEMKSSWRADVTNVHWEDGTWVGGFHVEWLSWTPIHFDEVRHLKDKEDGGPITRGMYILELCQATGAEMMRRFGVAHKLSMPAPRRPLPEAGPSRNNLNGRSNGPAVDRFHIGAHTKANTGVGHSTNTKAGVSPNKPINMNRPNTVRKNSIDIPTTSNTKGKDNISFSESSNTKGKGKISFINPSKVNSVLIPNNNIATQFTKQKPILSPLKTRYESGFSSALQALSNSKKRPWNQDHG